MKYTFYLCYSCCACMHAHVLSCVPLFETPWAIAYQAPLSMGFSRQAYWSGMPFPSPGHFPDPGIEPGSPALAGESLPVSCQGGPQIV